MWGAEQNRDGCLGKSLPVRIPTGQDACWDSIFRRQHSRKVNPEVRIARPLPEKGMMGKSFQSEPFQLWDHIADVWLAKPYLSMLAEDRE